MRADWTRSMFIGGRSSRLDSMTEKITFTAHKANEVQQAEELVNSVSVGMVATLLSNRISL